MTHYHAQNDCQSVWGNRALYIQSQYDSFLLPIIPGFLGNLPQNVSSIQCIAIYDSESCTIKEQLKVLSNLVLVNFLLGNHKKFMIARLTKGRLPNFS